MDDYRSNASKLKAAARGREVEILENVALIPRVLLDGKGHPCPRCGGRDRFALVDRDAGAVHCRKCFSTRNGDFISAVQWAREVGFREASRLVSEYLHLAPNGRSTASNANSPRARTKSFHTIASAVHALEAVHGETAGRWTYQDAAGNDVGLVLRWNMPNGKKKYRAIRRCENGWEHKGMPEPRPLYCRLRIDSADTVLVCEGEKAADAAAALGFIATTSPHGCKSAAKTDWGPLAGKSVVILPDADDDGQKYAEHVADILSKLSPPAEVKIVELLHTDDGADIVEWIAAGGTKERLQKLIEVAPHWYHVGGSQEIPEDRIGKFAPFPLHILPEPIRSYIKAAATALGTDPSFVALPMLAVLGSVIGNTRRILLKSNWREPPTLWTAIVGDSGTLKTPALSAATDHLECMQNKRVAEHAAAMESFQAAQLKREFELNVWRKGGQRGDPPPSPQAPILQRFIVGEATVEALVDRLQHAPRGLLLVRDELAGWLKSFGQYKGGKGGDEAHWLSMYNAKPLRIDRKTGATFTFIPSAAVSIAGGIQPETLRRCLSTEHFENGMAARFLLAFPPKRTRVWSEDSIDEEVQRRVADLFEALLQLQFTTDTDGNLAAIDVPLDRRAKRAWIEFFNHHGAEQAKLTGREAALWSKLEGTAPRLALIVHLVRIAAGDPTASPEAIDELSMQAGIGLADWFGHEAKRVYAALSETDEQRSERHLVELVGRNGGSMTPRELMRHGRKYDNADKAEKELDSLAKKNFGQWEVDAPGSKGGRPVRRFRLNTITDVDTTTGMPAESEVVSTPFPIEPTKQPTANGGMYSHE